MKRFILIATALLVFADLHSAAFEAGIPDNPTLRMNRLKSEVSRNLTGNLLPYWSAKMVDKRNGGFYGRIDINDRVFPDEDKGGILNARILWTYSSAYRILRILHI